MFPAQARGGASAFTVLNRNAGGMVLPDRARFGGAQVLVQADLFTGPTQFQTLGAIATIDQPSADFPKPESLLQARGLHSHTRPASPP